jgi:UDP-N-acetylglucosamine--N-acetylmuramyl-(pentapeptide) pyrophosphoryl-undecaprenol N-acetylglucosamine transferase
MEPKPAGRRMVIAGGGTGGHVFPGIAVAEKFLAYAPGNEVLFIGTARGLEATIVPREGFPLKTIKVEGFTGKSWAKKVISLSMLPRALIQSLWILLNYKPDVVLGVGGYVAGPIIIAAFLLRLPRIIQEQNLIPGVTNKLLGWLANGIAISFRESAQYFPASKTQLTGNPIRKELHNLCRNNSRARLSHRAPNQQEQDKVAQHAAFTLFIFGGSRGAHQINITLIKTLDYLKEMKGYLRFIHQTGQEDYQAVEKAYHEGGFSAQVFPFVYDMAERYREADLVICRAGATTIAELTALGKPAILIPYPYAAHNHQEHNASALKRHGAAELIQSQELTAEKLAHMIINLIHNPTKLDEMGKKSRQLGCPEAADKVVELCYQVMKS